MAVPPVQPTFWQQQNPFRQDPPAPGGEVLPATPGDAAPIPYQFLPGSESTDPTQVAAGRDAVFPLLTGDERDPRRRLGLERLAPFQLPPGFTDPKTTVRVDQFRSWHSALQIEYARREFPSTNPLGALSGLIGPEPRDGEIDTRLMVVVMPAPPVPVSSGPTLPDANAPRKILILNDLDKRDYGKLSLAEQSIIAALPEFQTRFAAPFGLIPAKQTSTATLPPFTTLSWPPGGAEAVDLETPAGAKRAVFRLITSLQQTIVSTSPFSLFWELDGEGALKEHEPQRASTELMTPADMRVFLDQVENLKTRALGSAIFAPNDIASALNEIQTRWNRAAAFANMRVDSGLPTTNAEAFVDRGRRGENDTVLRDRITYLNGYITNESDGGIGAVRQAYQVFMASERQILQLDNRRMQLAAGARLGQRNFDAPTLIAQFQFSYNGKIEARLNADAQEINQFNVLLKLYSAFQAQVNGVSGSFDPNNQDEFRGINGGGGNDPMESSFQQPLVATFRDGTFPGGPQEHPLETLYKIARPRFTLVDGEYKSITYRKNTWDQVNSTVSDRVTQINQQSQINSNNINSLDRQKNRHFDVANSALSKLSDMLQSIGRNLA